MKQSSEQVDYKSEGWCRVESNKVTGHEASSAKALQPGEDPASVKQKARPCTAR